MSVSFLKGSTIDGCFPGVWSPGEVLSHLTKLVFPNARAHLKSLFPSGSRLCCTIIIELGNSVTAIQKLVYKLNYKQIKETPKPEQNHKGISEQMNLHQMTVSS